MSFGGLGGGGPVAGSPDDVGGSLGGPYIDPAPILGGPSYPSHDPILLNSPFGGDVSDPIVLDSGEYTVMSSYLHVPHHKTWITAEGLYRHRTANPAGIADFGPYFHTNLRILVSENSALSADVELGLGITLNFTRDDAGDPFDAPAGFERYALYREVDGSDVQYFLVDSNGYEYEFEQDTAGGTYPLIATYNKYGQGETYSYDASGYLGNITVSAAMEISITRNAYHQITKIEDSDARVVEFTYDGSDRLVSVTDGCGACSGLLAAVSYVYDGSNRITAILDANGETVRSITYNGSNQVASYEDAYENEWSFTYNSATDVLINDPAGNTTAYSVDTDGNVTRMTVAKGTSDEATFVQSFDSSNRVTRRENPDGTVQKFTYDSRGRAYLVQLVANEGLGNEKTINVVDTSFDAYDGLPKWRKDGEGNQTDFTYNGSRHLTTITYPDDSTKTFTFNSEGLVTQVIDASGVKTDFDYDSLGRVKKQLLDPDNNTKATTFLVEKSSKVAARTPPDMATTGMKYDMTGNMTETSTNGIVTTFEYDRSGRLKLRIVNDGVANVETWSNDYDLMGRLVAATNPEGETTTTTYDSMGRPLTTMDPAGVVTRRTYDARGRVTKVEVGDGTTWQTRQQVTYDSMNRPLTIKDGENNTTTRAYDALGRLEKVTDALSHYTKYEYDDNSQPTSVKRYKSDDTLVSRTDTTYNNRGWPTLVRQYADADGALSNTLDAVMEMEYDDQGRVTKRKVHIDGSTILTTTNTYDTAGRLKTVTDPDNNTTTFTYNAAGLRTIVKDALNRETVTAYDVEGRVEKVTRPNGAFTTFTYNHRGQKTQEIFNSSDTTPVKMSKTTMTYDDNGRLLESRRWADPDATTGGANDHVTSNTYDATNGRLTKTTNASGEDTTYAHDATYGYRTKVTQPDGSYTEYLSFDGNGRATRIDRVEKIPGESDFVTRTEYEFDDLGRTVTVTNQGADGTFGNSDDLEVSYVFDELGRQTQVTNEAGQVTVTTYNDLGRKTEVKEDATNIGRVTQFEYDRSGRMTKLIAYTDSPSTGKQETQYIYNGRGLQTEVIYEETGSVLMTYDAVGNMTERSDEAGVRVVYTYDSDTDRLTERKQYGATTDIEKYQYDDMLRLTVVEKGNSANSDSVGKSTFTHDSLSRVTKETQWINEGSGRYVSYQYDAAGNRTMVTASGVSLATQFLYDSRDRVTTIKLNGVSRATYSWVGNAPKEREVEMAGYPGSTNPKIATIYTRDGLMRVTEVANELTTSDQADTGFNDLGTFTYTYDDASNPLTETQTGSLTWADADRTYTYDTLDRLKTAALTDTQTWTSASTITEVFNYDDLGNRTENIVSRDDSDIDYVHDKANRMTSVDGQSQTYDLAGNLTKTAPIYSGNAYRYAYDHHNRLIEVKEDSSGDVVANFTYDALGRRIIFEDVLNDETTHYYYDGVNEIVETSPSGTAKRFYIHGVSYVDERLLARDFTTGDDLDYAFTLDRMYNVRGVVDETGALRERVMYDSYGQYHIREMPGSGDFNNDGVIDSSDTDRMDDVVAATEWDPRGDADFDGDVDSVDEAIIDEKANIWNTTAAPVVARAYSTVGNSYLFQGRPQFIFDTLKVDDDSTGNDGFGHAARISGDYAVLGTPGEDSVASGAGAAYVYKYDGSDWRIFQKLTNDEGAALDSFGVAVSIDGTRIAVGAVGDDEAATAAGAVFVYELVGNAFVETAKLTASDAAIADLFGGAVALDGDVLVVGAAQWEDGTTGSGGAYVFRHDGTDWVEEAILEASDAQASAQFGSSVDVDTDAIVIGAPFHDVSSNSDAGKAYVFRYDDVGETWDEEDDLAAGDLDASAKFGAFVSISGDRLAIGAPAADYDPGSPTTPISDTGAVYIFEESSGAWTEAYKLHASDRAADDEFAAVNLDGDTLLVGAAGETSDTGAAYLFVFDDSGFPPTWDEDQIITASDDATGDRFGVSVSLDGNRLLAGSVWADIGTTNGAGAGYVFDYVSSDWDETGKVSALVPLVPSVVTHSLRDHRARFAAERWLTRDPKHYNSGIIKTSLSFRAANKRVRRFFLLSGSGAPVYDPGLFRILAEVTTRYLDPTGLDSESPCSENPHFNEETGEYTGSGWVECWNGEPVPCVDQTIDELNGAPPGIARCMLVHEYVHITTQDSPSGVCRCKPNGFQTEGDELQECGPRRAEIMCLTLYMQESCPLQGNDVLVPVHQDIVDIMYWHCRDSYLNRIYNLCNLNVFGPCYQTTEGPGLREACIRIGELDAETDPGL